MDCASSCGHPHDDNPGQAATYLRQALVIYRRIGAPGAKRVEETMRRHRITPPPG